jgi:hypothetical protein
VKAGELTGIIVYRWDRFGRNLKESLAVIEAAGGLCRRRRRSATAADPMDAPVRERVRPESAAC